MRDMQLLTLDEPFPLLLNQGMVQGATYRDEETGRPVAPADVTVREGGRAVHVNPATGDTRALTTTWEKMSKSKYNGVSPKDVIAQYGADTTRLFVLFKAPASAELQWDKEQIVGQYRFLKRLHRLAIDCVAAAAASSSSSSPYSASEVRVAAMLHSIRDQRVAKVTHEMDNFMFNTAIAQLHSMLTEVSKAAQQFPEHLGSEAMRLALRDMVVMLHPFAPHVSSELYAQLQGTPLDLESIAGAPWPIVEQTTHAGGEGASSVNDVATEGIESTAFVTVNGKKLGYVRLPGSVPIVDASGKPVFDSDAFVRDYVEAPAETKNNTRLKKALLGQRITRVIPVRRKDDPHSYLINFVVKQSK
jgi:leucyl-tRNA synthetase